MGNGFNCKGSKDLMVSLAKLPDLRYIDFEFYKVDSENSWLL